MFFECDRRREWAPRGRAGARSVGGYFEIRRIVRRSCVAQAALLRRKLARRAHGAKPQARAARETAQGKALRADLGGKDKSPPLRSAPAASYDVSEVCQVAYWREAERVSPAVARTRGPEAPKSVSDHSKRDPSVALLPRDGDPDRIANSLPACAFICIAPCARGLATRSRRLRRRSIARVRARCHQFSLGERSLGRVAPSGWRS